MAFRHVLLFTSLLIFTSACAGGKYYQPSASSPSNYVNNPFDGDEPQIPQTPNSAEIDKKPEKSESSDIEKSVVKDDSSSKNTRDIFARDDTPSLFSVEPDPDIWKAYYYFFHLRDDIIHDLDDASPDGGNLDIPVVMNDKVERFLDYFQTRGRVSFSIWLSRSGRFIPMMRDILESKGLPSDLVYLAMIESGFSVSARSHKGAVGPWQFIPATARRYGLRVDDWVDERMDPEKSTVAAANYLSDLYDMFENWELAAAGYNAGENRVLSAIETYKVWDFWEISEYTLPRETREYVPKLMAALIISRDLEKYGFHDIEYHEPKTFEKVPVPPQIGLLDLARIIGVDGSRLKELNPSLRRGATPPGGDYQINVPVGYSAIVKENYSYIASLNKVSQFTVAESSTRYYKVKRGDTLSKIAARQGISLASLKKANRIKGSTVKRGRVLIIPGGKAPEYDSYAVAESKPAKADPPRKAAAKPAPTVKHTVRRGETLHRVALRYGVSIDSIKSANSIRGNTIKTGQSLRIPGGVVATAKASDNNVVKHRVKRGDTLWNIANRYDVSVTEIKGWNNLRSSNLALGERLTIYVK